VPHQHQIPAAAPLRLPDMRWLGIG
jgi:hypothetical protein